MHAHTYQPQPYVPRGNPLVGTGLGILFGLGAVAGGAYLVKTLIDRNLLGKALQPAVGPGGQPPRWLPEIAAVLQKGATLADNKILAAPPFALNTLGLSGVDGPSTEQFPFMTQPEPGSVYLRGKAGTEIPLTWIFTKPDGEVGFRIDKPSLAAQGIAFDVSAEATYGDGKIAGALEQGTFLITDLSHELAQHAFKTAVVRIKDGNEAYDQPSQTRDAFIREVLAKFVPSYDWSGAPGNLGATPRQSSVAMLWHGVSLVGQVTYQNFWNMGQQQQH